MTVGLTDLLDLAISPQIGPVNFFHLRNLLHTLLDHFDIGEVEAQQAEVKHPVGYSSSEASSSSESSDESENEDEESGSEGSDGEEEVEEKVVEKEVTKTVIGDDGEEKTITVTETVTVSVPKPKVKKDKEGGKEGGEEKKKHKDKDKSKNKDEKKDRKKSKHEKEGENKEEGEKDEKKSKKKDKEKDKKDKSGYGSYGKEDKKKKDKLSLEDIGEAPQIINLTRRIDAAEAGIKSLRNIIDSMVNQVDFGDDVGNLLKDQLAQVQNQLNAVQLVPETEPKKEKKKKGSKSKDVNEVPALGIITEGAPVTNAPGTQLSGLAPSTVPVIPAVIPAVIPPKASQTATRKGNTKAGVPIKGKDTRPPSQEGKPPLRRRTTMQDLKMRKMAREEGLTIEEVEAREAKKEQQKNEENQEDEKNDKTDAEKKDKEKKDEDAENTSDEESMDSEEEREAMEEMLREEIEAALENTDDPEAQAYALRLGLEQMSNMKKNVQAVQEEIRKDMDKNKRAIEQITKELIAFRAARKAQDAEGFNAVHHVHSMVLELQAKHEKVISTTSELVNEYNRREKTMEELFGHVDRLDQNKADKTNVSKEIDVKADKMDLESKVSMMQFDETFNLLDQGLNEALEKMGNQMTLEEALKETLSDLQNKMNMKLDRDDLVSLREQLESRIKEVQMSRVMVKEVKEEGEPAGFRRNTEKVHCISCDRPLEVQPGNVGTNGPKMQGLPAHKSGKPYTTYELEHIRQNNKLYASKKAVIGADLGYHAQKLKNDVIAMTGVTDLVDLPPSQRYCGGSHTIMHPFRRSFKSTSSHFNQYVVVREDEQTTVGLPRRDFIVPKNESTYRRYSKVKPLPAIGQTNTREPSPPMDYERLGERPASAPATPSLGSHPPVGIANRVSPPQEGSSPVSPSPGLDRQGTSPVEVETISVTIPTPDAENDPN